MITIAFLGLDQYIVGRLSKELLAKLANLFETKEENISFYAPNSQIYHNGVEQTSWNGVIRVFAPEKFKPFQKNVARYLLEETIDYIINVRVEFLYYSEENSYERTNHDYPHFITEENLVSIDEEEETIDEEEPEIYDGNIFEDFEKKISNK